MEKNVSFRQRHFSHLKFYNTKFIFILFYSYKIKSFVNIVNELIKNIPSLLMVLQIIHY